MRGVVALAPDRRGRQGEAGRGALRVDAFGQFLQVGRREQLLQRIGDPVRIAEQAAIAIGTAQDLGHQVRALRRLGLAPIQLLEHRQALGEGHAAGRRRWRADQLALVVQAEAQRLTLHGAVVAQVGEGPDATGGLHALHQLFRDFAFVETDPPVARHPVQRARQFRLAQQVPFLRQVAAVEEYPRGFRIVAHGIQAPIGAVEVDPIDGHAVGGQANGRHQVVGERLAAVAAGDIHQRSGQPGNAGGQRTVQRKRRLHLAITYVKVLVGCEWRAFAGVDETVGRRVAGLAQEEETAAAKARTIGLGHRQRGADRHCGIESVAAVGEGFQTGHGGGGMGRGDRALRRALGGVQNGPEQL
ncbi:hypothetical protein D3C76_954970 [compost metagenome]